MKNIEIAEAIAEEFNGKVWEGREKLRVYIGKGYAEITDQGVDINAVKSAQFSEVKEFSVNTLGVKAYR